MTSPEYQKLNLLSIHRHQEWPNWKRFKKISALSVIIFIVVLLVVLLTYSGTWKRSMPDISGHFSLPCLLLGTMILNSAQMQEYYACESEVYCQGPLLHAAQYAYIYNDSKSFVDMQMNYDEDKVIADFNSLLNETDHSPSSEQVQNFVHEYFNEPNSEFEHWTPDDWKETPAFLNQIMDLSLRSWANELNMRWKDLGRRIKDDVKSNSSRYSIIYSSNPVVVPGGRFREFYYWDNYWIIRGLLLSEMYDTAKGTIVNFLDMVKRFGFVPNGGRLYYTRRSQPPFLTIMVRDYIEQTGDDAFLEEALPTLELEHLFWEQNRTIVVKDSNGVSHSLSRYGSDVNQPRAESYREDYELVNEHNLSEGACREEDAELLLNLRTRDVIPVDLNSILAMVERTLADFNKRLGRQSEEDVYLEKYQKRVEGMEKINWNEEDGVYYDYIISQKSHNRQFFLSNVNPLWTKAYPNSVDVDARERKIYNYLRSQTYEGVGVLDFPGGIPTSLNYSGEQWDFPNAWPPLVHMTIEGMKLSNVKELQGEAFRQAQKWIRTGWRGFSNPRYDKAMFEKYNVLRDDGVPGSGGEYQVQEGFGWTNGVVMIFMDAYGQQLTANEAITTEIPEITTSGTSNTRDLATFVISVVAAVVLTYP